MPGLELSSRLGVKGSTRGLMYHRWLRGLRAWSGVVLTHASSQQLAGFMRSNLVCSYIAHCLII